MDFKAHDKHKTPKTQKDEKKYPKIIGRKFRLRYSRNQKIMTTHKKCVTNNSVVSFNYFCFYSVAP